MIKEIRLFICLALLSVVTANAETRRPKLEDGISSSEVIRRWGSPTEIEEHESKRRQVWSYSGDSKVTIENGKVVSFHDSSAYALEVARANEEQEKVVPPTIVASSDLVREIARELPSGPDVVGSDSSAPEIPTPSFPAVNPGMPNQVFQGMPQAGAIQQAYPQPPGAE